MARKSGTQRLQDIETAHSWYVAAGIQNDNRARFLNDMISRLNRGKYPTKKQREWADSLFEAGPPKTHNDDRVNEIRELASLERLNPKSAEIMQDFASRLARGYALSDKQETFLENLVAQARLHRDQGPYRPGNEALSDLKVAVEVGMAKDGYYFNHRPGTAKALQKVRNWIDWNKQRKAMEDLELGIVHSQYEPINEPDIDEWSVNKLLQSFKKPVAEIRDPSMSEGTMRWTRKGELALVTGSPKISGGYVVYPCLINCHVVEMTLESLLKRRPKI